MKKSFVWNRDEWYVVWEALAQFVENTECSDSDIDETKLEAARCVLERMDGELQALGEKVT